MTTPFTPVPDTRATGTGSPAQDMNNTSNELAAMGGGFNVLDAAFAGGADPTDTSACDSALAAAVAALPGSGGALLFPPGTYKMTSGLVIAAYGVYLVPVIPGTVTFDYHGSGDCVRMYNPSYPSPANFTGITGWGGGILGGIVIDGTNSSAGAAGVHIGDGEEYQLDCTIQHFNGTGSKGLHLDNTVWWTEKMRARVRLFDNTANVVLDVSGATTSTNSFGYNDLDFRIFANPGQDGVQVTNGALLYHARLLVKGNFIGSSSPVSNAALRLSGSVPAGHTGGGSSFSAIENSHVDVQVESTSSTFTAQTINFGTDTAILGCYGMMDFSQGSGTFATSNVTVSAAAGQFIFAGIIDGDVHLNPGANSSFTVQGGQVYSQSFMSGANGNTFTASGDFFAATLSANVTIDLGPSGQNGGKTVSGPQRKTIILTQAASGGPYTVTWSKPGSPTTSAPAIYWTAGTAPTMSTAAGATDVYKLETLDGVHWYGQALQAVA